MVTLDLEKIAHDGHAMMFLLLFSESDAYVSCRHIFEGRKYVEEYHTSDVERELGMDRLGLICLALLLGSDYTEGVAGIGIVNAVEVWRHSSAACHQLHAIKLHAISYTPSLTSMARNSGCALQYLSNLCHLQLDLSAADWVIRMPYLLVRVWLLLVPTLYLDHSLRYCF